MSEILRLTSDDVLILRSTIPLTPKSFSDFDENVMSATIMILDSTVEVVGIAKKKSPVLNLRQPTPEDIFSRKAEDAR